MHAHMHTCTFVRTKRIHAHNLSGYFLANTATHTNVLSICSLLHFALSKEGCSYTIAVGNAGMQQGTMAFIISLTSIGFRSTEINNEKEYE